MSDDQPMVHWKVTITCQRPRRLPNYVGDDWSMTPERLHSSLAASVMADDYEVTFTRTRVKVTCTLRAPRDFIRNRFDEPARLPPFRNVEAVTCGMAYMLLNAKFALEGAYPGELPGPITYDVREVMEGRPENPGTEEEN